MIPQMHVSLTEDLNAPVYRLNTLVLGAGAAGMNCAVHLYEFLSARGVPDPQDRITVVTAGLPLGASRMSGSDKQTYYKRGTSVHVPDSAADFAKALTAFGCMHGDIALAEGESSLREFFHLVQAGVPFPHDPEGAYIGYKTDHDPYERATSAGPKTSKFMSECLQRQVVRCDIRIFDKHEAVHFLTSTRGGERRIVGLVTIDKSRLEQPDLGLTVFLCENVVIAAGGPGELYEVSAYPHGQVGIHGLALSVGLKVRNMIEWQFGLASTGFRWNVSGTYMQAIPRIFSTDRDGGDAREFLAPCFPGMSKMATDIFLKGYQWPFDAQRLLDHQSSLIDLLVTRETRSLGRRAFLDFRENPRPGPNGTSLDLADLEEEALVYLRRNDALQATPIGRLMRMNPLAIDVYREHNIDLAKEPLEIDVCAQHHNGGFAVDKWWQANIAHTFVIGEAAGTHGVKRPGGAALNSGQVGGLRAAEYIASVYGDDIAPEQFLGAEQRGQVRDLFNKLRHMAETPSKAPRASEAIAAIQQRSTRGAAHMRDLETAEACLREARDLALAIRKHGLAPDDTQGLVHAIQAGQMALTQVALFEALVDYLRRDGGSRGSYVVLKAHGDVAVPEVIDPATGKPYRYIAENESLRQEIAEFELTDADQFQFTSSAVPVRPVPHRDEIFERMWAAYRSGEIFNGA